MASAPAATLLAAALAAPRPLHQPAFSRSGACGDALPSPCLPILVSPAIDTPGGTRAVPHAVRLRGGSSPEARYVAVALVGGAALVLALQSIALVSQNDVVVVERLGRFHRRLEAGLHGLVPILDRAVLAATLKEQVLDVPPQQCITRDNAPISADAVVMFRIADAVKAHYAVDDMVVGLESLVLTQLRAEVGKLTLDETFAARAELSRRLLAGISDVVAGWGVHITRIEVKDITPSPQILSSLELQMSAERHKRAAVLKSEGEQTARVNAAEGNKTATVLEAEASKTAVVLAAEGERQALEREGAGIRAALDEISAGLRDAAGPEDIPGTMVADRAVAILLTRQQQRTHAAIGQSGATKVVFMPAGLQEAAESAARMLRNSGEPAQ